LYLVSAPTADVRLGPTITTMKETATRVLHCRRLPRPQYLTVESNVHYFVYFRA